MRENDTCRNVFICYTRVRKRELPPRLNILLGKNGDKRFLLVSFVDIAQCDHAIRFTGMVLFGEI
jgi:hypothetical protein